MSPAYPIAVTATAAGLLIYAAKRALLGDRPLIPSLIDWLRGNRHTPIREPLGYRCSYCGALTNDLDEWGYGGRVSVRRDW